MIQTATYILVMILQAYLQGRNMKKGRKLNKEDLTQTLAVFFWCGLLISWFDLQMMFSFWLVTAGSFHFIRNRFQSKSFLYISDDTNLGQLLNRRKALVIAFRTLLFALGVFLLCR